MVDNGQESGKYLWSQEREPDLDLGSGWIGFWYGWHPDRELNPQYAESQDVERAGMMLEHPDARDSSKTCMSAILFDLPELPAGFTKQNRWQVQSWEPLTLTPSILCTESKGGCGAHGFITEGKWVPC